MMTEKRGLFGRKKKPEFYSLERILESKSIYNVIFGERSNGKTYAVLKHGLEEYFKNGGEIAVVRRWQEDIRGNRASGVWTALIENGEIGRASCRERV